jgi:hypothetical protein
MLPHAFVELAGNFVANIFGQGGKMGDPSSSRAYSGKKIRSAVR